jgi:uncharacterized protein (TIGR02646 family)
MIRVPRLSKPTILVQKETEWRDALLQASTVHEKERALTKYCHRQIQETLDRMFHGKCAYCESKIEHVSDAHIEHYRPKSRFPRLAFDWENLLLACGKCNSPAFKGNHFPEAGEDGPLLNPCIDDPESHLRFDYNSIAKLASVYGTTPRGVTTETLLGLNRPELRAYRSQQIQRLAFIAVRAQTDPEARQLLDEAQGDNSEYAAFARILPSLIASHKKHGTKSRKKTPQE